MYDKKYFEKRGLEQKHYYQVMQFLKYVIDEDDKNDEKGKNGKDEITFYDYGCGRGPYVHAVKYFGYSVNGYDINSSAILNPVWGVEGFISGNLSSDEHSVVLCLDVMEHVQPSIEQTVIKNLERLTRSKGYLILSICDITLKDKYFDETHVNLRSRSYWVNKFVKAGFVQCKVPDYWYFRDQFYIFRKSI